MVWAKLDPQMLQCTVAVGLAVEHDGVRRVGDLASLDKRAVGNVGEDRADTSGFETAPDDIGRPGFLDERVRGDHVQASRAEALKFHGDDVFRRGRPARCREEQSAGPDRRLRGETQPHDAIMRYSII
jgi:hypothetical protein